MSSVKRVKYLIKKHPSKATTPNRIIITQNPIQHRHVRNSTSNCLQNWNAVKKKNRAVLNSVSLGIYSKLDWSRIVTFHLCDWLNSPAPFSFKQSPACLRFSRAWPAKPVSWIYFEICLIYLDFYEYFKTLLASLWRHRHALAFDFPRLASHTSSMYTLRVMIGLFRFLRVFWFAGKVL